MSRYKMEVEKGFYTERRISLSEAQNHRCACCGKKLDPYSKKDEDRSTVEHVNPRAWGGCEKDNNLVVTCFMCNNNYVAQRMLGVGMSDDGDYLLFLRARIKKKES